jgi:hypothetical protein
MIIKTYEANEAVHITELPGGSAGNFNQLQGQFQNGRKNRGETLLPLLVATYRYRYRYTPSILKNKLLIFF